MNSKVKGIAVAAFVAVSAIIGVGYYAHNNVDGDKLSENIVNGSVEAVMGVQGAIQVGKSLNNHAQQQSEKTGYSPLALVTQGALCFALPLSCEKEAAAQESNVKRPQPAL